MLKFGFPGTLRQPVARAFGGLGSGTKVLGPDGEPYYVADFSRDSKRCTGGEFSTIVEPLVLKPVPGDGVDARRATLHQAADAANALLNPGFITASTPSARATSPTTRSIRPPKATSRTSCLPFVPRTSGLPSSRRTSRWKEPRSKTRIVEASGYVGTEFVNGVAAVTVQAGQTEDEDIVIGAPDPKYRVVTVFTPQEYQGGVFILDDEIGSVDSDWHHFSKSFPMDLDPNNNTSSDDEDDAHRAHGAPRRADPQAPRQPGAVRRRARPPREAARGGREVRSTAAVA